MPRLRFGGRAFGISVLDFNFGVLTEEFARLVGGDERVAGSGESCVAAVVGADVTPGENVFVVGDAFLKSWYTVFNYGGKGGRPSVSFAQAV